VQLDELGGAQHRDRERRVVHGQQGAVLGGSGEDVGQPGQLVGRELAVVVPGDAGVERDDPQAVDLVHAVLGARVVGVEEPAGERLALVVVAHGPHDDRTDPGRERLDDRPQGGVGLGLAPVGEVAGEHQRLRRGPYGCQPVEGATQVVDVVDDAVVQAPATDQVRVAEVRDDVPRGGVLTELFHDEQPRTDGKAHRGLRTRLADRSPACRAAVGRQP
jgi:hypothetical protein